MRVQVLKLSHYHYLFHQIYFNKQKSAGKSQIGVRKLTLSRFDMYTYLTDTKVYYSLMLLFQKEPHFYLPFSTTHMNLHLGKMIRDMEYKAPKTFAKYMKNNVNHKLVPIQRGRPGSSKVKRQIQFDSYYTTKRLAAGMPQPINATPKAQRRFALILM